MRKLLILSVFVTTLISCSATYDQVAFENALRAKQSVLSIIDTSQFPYSEHEKTVDSLKVRLKDYYIYETTRKHNKASIAIWKKVNNENGSFYKFLGTWKSNTSLGAFFRKEYKTQMEGIFNEILELEEAKK